MTQAKEDVRDMNLLFYSTVTSGAGERLLRMIEEVVPAEKRGICRTIDSLIRRLHRPGHRPTIAVLFAASRDDFLGILSIRDLFFDVQIILILPDREEDTIAKGHTLRPRFLTYSDSDFGNVASVLRKMLGNAGPPCLRL